VEKGEVEVEQPLPCRADRLREKMATRKPEST